MDKLAYEKLNEGVINLYLQWIFIRCFEKTAMNIRELTWYRVYANIDKKTGFIYLELWFPKEKMEELQKQLEENNYYIRIIDNKWNIEEIIWKKRELISLCFLNFNKKENYISI